MFSICCCSYKDFEYFKLLHQSLKRNSKVPYELIVHLNEATEEQVKWLEEHKDIKYTTSKENLGVAAVNNAVKLAKYDFIVDINADMYVLPMWDIEVLKQINKFKQENISKYTISATLVEPIGNNPEFTIFNAGTTPENFDQTLLINSFAENFNVWQKPDVIQYSHPIMMPKSLWEEIDGVDTKFWPGQASDHDIAAKVYKAGCRHFKRLGKSKVYHFVSRGIDSLPQELKSKHGQDIFQEKWKMSVDQFRQKLGVNSLFNRTVEGIL